MNQPERLRFGFHNFLNAQPLLVPLREIAGSCGIDIVTGSPADIAHKLHAGEIDLGMTPSIEYLRQGDRYRLLPGWCIASRKEVGTVLLVTKKKLREIRSIALDERSKTSIALLVLLMGHVLPADTQLNPMTPAIDPMLAENDAALIIGDQALDLDRRKFPGGVFDLSQAWYEMTGGKAFVHAVVAVREEIIIDQAFIDLTREAKRRGQSRIGEIARQQAEEMGLDEELCRDYLEEKIIYDLGEEELLGLAHFRDLCADNKLLPQKFPITFV